MRCKRDDTVLTKQLQRIANGHIRRVKQRHSCEVGCMHRCPNCDPISFVHGFFLAPRQRNVHHSKSDTTNAYHIECHTCVCLYGDITLTQLGHAVDSITAQGNS